MNTSSTLSEAKKLLRGSEAESRFNLRAVGMLALGVVVLFFFVNILRGGASGALPFGLSAQRPMPEPTAQLGPPTPTVAVFAMEPTPTAWPTPIIITQDRVVEVPIEVTREVAVYYEIPIEVTRVVTAEVTPVPIPTITPVPLAPGTVEICASVEGARALYIGNEGVVSGGCKTYSFGVGQTTILVQVNR